MLLTYGYRKSFGFVCAFLTQFKKKKILLGNKIIVKTNVSILKGIESSPCELFSASHSLDTAEIAGQNKT